ncbi:Protein of unknown function, partial [Gryllus bimaculatus]
MIQVKEEKEEEEGGEGSRKLRNRVWNLRSREREDQVWSMGMAMVHTSKDNIYRQSIHGQLQVNHKKELPFTFFSSNTMGCCHGQRRQGLLLRRRRQQPASGGGGLSYCVTSNARPPALLPGLCSSHLLAPTPLQGPLK